VTTVGRRTDPLRVRRPRALVLFADLRGSTAFVERQGDAAAADLLDAYRELVRAEVARHAGAEIRTEGDSFYVVFGSARRAVACAVAIVDAAERASRDRPERPIYGRVARSDGDLASLLDWWTAEARLMAP
jgi:class 3 adenylate cyclase